MRHIGYDAHRGEEHLIFYEPADRLGASELSFTRPAAVELDQCEIISSVHTARNTCANYVKVKLHLFNYQPDEFDILLN